MGYRELIDALRREGEDKAAAIHREAETEAERVRQEAEERLTVLREEYARRKSAAVAAATGSVLAEARYRERRIRVASETALADRLYLLARRILPSLREEAAPFEQGPAGRESYRALFSALVAELPPWAWETVRVNPADEELARRFFAEAEIVADATVTGGLEVTSDNGCRRVDNTLEKRLERGWADILPGLMKEVEKGR